MKPRLELVTTDKTVDVRVADGALLFRYTYNPDTPVDESPRPYLHPLCTCRGALLTNFRPNDHRWHHGLSFTLTAVEKDNFWGGPSYRPEDGYQWRADHGRQIHREWSSLEPDLLEHRIDWHGVDGAKRLEEQRILEVTVEGENAWSLRWKAELKNVSGRALVFSQYQSGGKLRGSHYTGLQFRGARDLLDEHGDSAIGIFNAAGVQGDAVHGAASEWMEWRGQKDETQQRVRVRFANNTGSLHWFVRRPLPLVAFPFHYDSDLTLAAGASLIVDHSLTFVDQ